MFSPHSLCFNWALQKSYKQICMNPGGKVGHGGRRNGLIFHTGGAEWSNMWSWNMMHNVVGGMCSTERFFFIFLMGINKQHKHCLTGWGQQIPAEVTCVLGLDPLRINRPAASTVFPLITDGEGFFLSYDYIFWFTTSCSRESILYLGANVLIIYSHCKSHRAWKGERDIERAEERDVEDRGHYRSLPT